MSYRETLRATGRDDVRPRPHLLGWGEFLPTVGDATCPICGARAGELHDVVSLGIDETLGILGYLPRAVVKR